MVEATVFREIILEGRTNAFAVLDGVLVPKLPKRLYSSGLPNFCLLTGELTPDMIYAAPYVVQLAAGNEFAEWLVAEGRGKNWGIFAKSLMSMTEMRRHFRALVKVYSENGEPMLFRFYDPRVLRKFLPTCNGGELAAIFGKVLSYYAESENSLTRFEFVDGQLIQTDIE